MVYTRSVKFDEELKNRIETAASRLGLTPSDIIILALRRYFDMKVDKATNVCQAVASYVESQIDPFNFPRDVTRSVFLWIRDDKKMMDMYREAVDDGNGNVDEKKVWNLNKRIGKLVKQVLKASVDGRTATPLPEDELIKGHTFLVPGQ